MQKYLFLFLVWSPWLFAQDLKPLIAVSNYPLQWVCEILVGDQAQIVNLTKQSPSPREWVPDDKSLALLKEADLIFMHGGGYEKWGPVKKDDRYVKTADKVLKTYVKQRKLTKEQQALYEMHVDGFRWIDPLYLQLQAEYIAKVLQEQLEIKPIEPGLKKIQVELGAMGKHVPFSYRLQTGWVMGITPLFEHTLKPAYGWNIRTVPEGFRSGEPVQNPDWPVFYEFFEFFPARTAIVLGKQNEEMTTLLQKRLQIHTHFFDPVEKQTDPEKTYPELMRENFLLLTRGFSS